jgi:hypothetical protein
VASALPKFARGLKLSRIGVIAMLLQLALTIVMTVRSIAIDDREGAISLIEWTSYLMLASIVSTGLMLVGVAMSLGELKRVGMDITKMLVALAGFLIATAALAWTYHVFSEFVSVLFDIDSDSSFERLEAASKDLESLSMVAVAKDVGYGLGLIMLIRMVQVQAAANDQISMRDDAGHMSRAIMVMLAGDIFYQLTYGLGSSGGGGILTSVGSLLIGLYWIWCHIKLVRFFENAAHFMNEPHDLPMATAHKVPAMKDLKPKPAPRTSRPSMPRIPDAAAPPPVLVVQPPVSAPVPRAPSATSDGEAPAGDGPKFLR